MCRTDGSQELSQIILSVWKQQSFLSGLFLPTDVPPMAPHLLFPADGSSVTVVSSSSWFLDDFEFQLKPAQTVALSPSELKAAAPWIPSCQAKQLQVDYKRLLLLLMISWVWNSYLSKSCSPMSLCRHWGQSSPHSSRFLLNFYFARCFCCRDQAVRYRMTKATRIWELEARLPMSLANSWALVQGFPFWSSLSSLTLPRSTVEEDSHDWVISYPAFKLLFKCQSPMNKE